MHKKSQKTTKKSNKKKINLKKPPCSACDMKYGLTLHIQNALCRKYSSYHFSYLNTINNMVDQTPQNTHEVPKQHLEKYYRGVERKHEFPKLKQIYKLYKEVPKLFLPDIQQIINKCHHRKRLLQYFKLAKTLGLKVQSVKFSTFLLSLSKTNQNPENHSHYDKLIGQISGYDFSQQIQRQILQTMSGKQNPSGYRNLKINV